MSLSFTPSQTILIATVCGLIRDRPYFEKLVSTGALRHDVATCTRDLDLAFELFSSEFNRYLRYKQLHPDVRLALGLAVVRKHHRRVIEAISELERVQSEASDS